MNLWLPPQRQFARYGVALVFSIFQIVCTACLVAEENSAKPRTDDLWDITNGVVVTRNSPTIYDPRDLFGGTFSVIAAERGNFVFADEVGANFRHSVEWRTPKPVTVGSFRLFARGDGPTTQRELGQFVLKTKSPGSQVFDKTLFEATPAHPLKHLNSEFLLFESTITPVTAQEFRAEFVSWAERRNRPGPRLIELDGFPPQGISSPRATTQSPQTTGITLLPGWEGKLQGGRETMEELQQVLAPFAQASSDTGVHPEIVIYPGVRYLMPIADAVKALGSPRQLSTRSVAACPGFPLNSLFINSFDGIFEGGFNRLYLVTDRADKVVSLQFVSESPKGEGALRIVPFRTYNFVNSRMKAARDYQVHLTSESKGPVLKVHTSLHGNKRTLEEALWYIPKPLAGLILTCIKGVTEASR